MLFANFIIIMVIYTFALTLTMKQNQQNKETIIYSLYCFLKDPEETQDQQELPQTIQKWCRIVDRGGLFHCTNESLFDSYKISNEEREREIVEHSITKTNTLT